MKNDISGIYSITNTINQKKYIGSSKHIYSRWREHKRLLKKNKHHSGHLQKSWNKYGEDSFKFDVVCECDCSELLLKEQYYIDYYKSYQEEFGYNISSTAKGGTVKCYSIDDIDKYNYVFTKEQFIKIIELLQDPFNQLIDIANLIHVKPWVVNEISSKVILTEVLKDIDIPPRVDLRQYMEENKEKIFDMIDSGMSASQVGKLMRVGDSWMGYFLKKYNYNKPRRTTIYKFDIHGTLIKKYTRCSDAAKEINEEKYQNIAAEIFGYIKRQELYKGYFWSRNDTLWNKNELENKVGSYLNKNAVVAYNKDDDSYIVFNSYEACSTFFNITHNKIRAALKTKELIQGFELKYFINFQQQETDKILQSDKIIVKY